MNKTLLIAPLAVVALAAPAVTGWIVERGADDRIAAITDQMPLLTLQSRTYRAGWFSSDETLTFELLKGMKMPSLPTPPAADGVAPPLPAPTPKPLLFVIHNHIQHGPLPGLSSVGLARIESEFAAAPGGDPGGGLDPAIAAPKFETVLGLFGGGRTTVSSKAYADLVLKDQSRLSADPAELVIDFGRHFDTFDIEWKVPHVLVTQASGTRIEVAGLHLSSHNRRILRSLYGGESEGTIGSIEFTGLPGKDGPIALGIKVLQAKTEAKASGEFVDSSAVFTLSALDVAGKHFRGLKFDASTEHWQAEAFERLMSGMRAAGRDNGADPSARVADMMKVWKTAGADLATHDPVFRFRDFEFLAEEGFAKLSGTFGIAGATASDFAEPLSPAKLVPKVSMDLDITLDESLYTAMRAQTTKPEVTEPAVKPRGTAKGRAAAAPPDPLEGMIAQGYVAREGGKLHAHLVFLKGVFTVNGKPFPGGPPPTAP